jgi:hypothetical protein
MKLILICSYFSHMNIMLNHTIFLNQTNIYFFHTMFNPVDAILNLVNDYFLPLNSYFEPGRQYIFNHVNVHFTT